MSVVLNPCTFQQHLRARPEWRARYQRLLDRGRPKKEALTILSRAVLKVVYHLLRTGTCYDPTALSPLKPGPAPAPVPARA